MKVVLENAIRKESRRKMFKNESQFIELFFKDFYNCLWFAYVYIIYILQLVSFDIYKFCCVIRGWCINKHSEE